MAIPTYPPPYNPAAVAIEGGTATGLTALATTAASSTLLGGAAASATSSLAVLSSKTLAAPAAGSLWDGIANRASTLTVTMGAGAVTITALKAVNLYGPTILTGTGAGALTVTNAYNVYIGAAPVAGSGTGATTLTNSWSLGVAGAVQIGSMVGGAVTTGHGLDITFTVMSVGDAFGAGPLFYLQTANGYPTVNSRNNHDLRFSANNAYAFSVTASGQNLVLGATAAGATAAKCLALTNAATAPSASADLVHLYSADIAASRATLAIWQEEAVAADIALVSASSLTVYINGTRYKLMLAASA